MKMIIYLYKRLILIQLIYNISVSFLTNSSIIKLIILFWSILNYLIYYFILINKVQFSIVVITYNIYLYLCNILYVILSTWYYEILSIKN